MVQDAANFIVTSQSKLRLKNLGTKIIGGITNNQEEKLAGNYLENLFLFVTKEEDSLIRRWIKVWSSNSEPTADMLSETAHHLDDTLFTKS